MPSACIKTEKKSSVEPEEAIKQCLSVVEKKVRNLEKRKGKLDTYKEQSDKGEAALNEDQKEAISKYDTVVRNLEFARELHKQFNEIHDKAEKLLKRREKFDKQQKHNEEVARIQELLQVQNLLDSMGGEEVRGDFQAGKRGAVTLSEDSLNQLDELYKLISPTRDGEVSYEEQLLSASEHIVNYLDGKDKEVAGTTYKNLKDLVAQINQCGYFDKSHSEQAEEESPEDTTAAEQATETTEVVQESSEPKEEEALQQPESNTTPSLQQQMMYSGEEGLTAPSDHTQVPTGLPAAMASQGPAAAYTDVEQVTQDSFFSTSQVERPRGFQEIVSSVSGDFNFLQDSEIEKQNKQDVSHVDPAVVAAHPMAGGSLHQSDALQQSYGSAAAGYQPGQALLDEAQYQPQTQQAPSVDQTLAQSAYVQDAMVAPTQPTQTQSQSQKYGQSAAAYDSTPQDTATNQWANPREHSETRWSSADSQPWAQPDQTPAAPTQAWSLPPTATPAADTTQQPSAAPSTGRSGAQSWAEQAAAGTGATQSSGGSTGAWGEQSQGSQQAWSTAGNQSDPKTSSLNPNADIFVGAYQNQSSQGYSSQDTRSSSYDSRKNDDYNSQNDGYQVQGGYRGRRDYDSRGRGGRGGPRGGMSNGYRGGNRGGGGNFRGNDDRRGGYSSDRGSRGGNRGSSYSQSSSSSFQGYPPRNDYQPEGGYQGMNNGFGGFDSGSGSYGSNKRGGQRGGGFRGGNRGGDRGRGSRGGSRPNSAHQQ